MLTPREAGGKSDSRAAGSTSILKVLEDEAARAGAPYGREEPISQVDPPGPAAPTWAGDGPPNQALSCLTKTRSK